MLAPHRWPGPGRASILTDVSGAPGPDGRHDDLEADELEGLALLVPDDARSLDPDRLRYVEELRVKAGRPGPGPAGPPAVPPSGRLSRFGLPASLVVVVLVVIGLVGSAMSVFAPRMAATPAIPRPLASAPTAEPGQVGGLLPDAAVTVAGREMSLQEVRPALVAMVPTDCADCEPVLQSLLQQGREYGLRLVLAGPAPAEELTGIDRRVLGGAATVVDDGTGALADAVEPSGVTAVLVDVDGTIGAVVRDVTADLRLEPLLSQLGRQGSSGNA